MEDKLNTVILGLLPPGSKINKVYKSDAGDIKADVTVDGMGDMTCTIKKNHAGDLYLE